MMLWSFGDWYTEVSSEVRSCLDLWQGVWIRGEIVAVLEFRGYGVFVIVNVVNLEIFRESKHSVILTSLARFTWFQPLWFPCLCCDHVDVDRCFSLRCEQSVPY